MCIFALSACVKRSAWDAPDYSRVYDRAREYDSGYSKPSILSCVDDDLYNCR